MGRENIKYLKTPLDHLNVINDLRAGDVVFISGKIFTARDQAHKRIIEEGSPFDLKGSAIFHAGPIIKKKNFINTGTNDKLDFQSQFKVVAIGPTTSMRMNPYETKVIDNGAKIIIGKGGMDNNVAEALKRNNAVYAVAVGGCAALYVDSIKKINNVYWLDLGIPEAIWDLTVENFGPLIIAMDSKGNSLFK
ncbi:FumA C-terminus/TtdB family hydratase beta subunit [Methanobrevibacter filiformis]|uniref:L(+)-tartrate dehydratase subunit beta n=1 Tax=Methanobrevibacter filiformis TaxID=55758 RepID=A0A165ZH81_9EURY|nr:FumA C-terminus/TtdB family hydratase beta subunit [Methanobrevibacter filiformis]KZX10713.1 L(+)-tartrate dehydratase subunit beta [Methanobrevibacter filiformis]